MNVSQLITASLLATSLVGITTAHASENNPLHPSYIWGKAQLTAVARKASVVIATPITNPLHPVYFAAKVSAAPFVVTGAPQPGRYVDDRNPLHPGFRRS